MENQYIEKAVEQFNALLTEQIAREDRMAAGAERKDFSNMEKITIGVCGGDGIGPIIVNEAKRVLEFLLKD